MATVGRKGRGVFYVSCDIEGMSGFAGGGEAARERNDSIMREHMTALAEGLREGGAGRILLKSFHGVPDGLPNFVETIRACPPGEFDLPRLPAGCRGLVLLGFHGLAPECGFGHAYRYDYLVLNGRRCGEIAIQVMLAASRGIPAAMLAGDSFAVSEFLALAPEAVTVTIRPGKAADEGGMSAAVLDEIRDAAREAARRGRFPLPKLPPNFKLELPMRTGLQAELAVKLPYPVGRDGLRVWRESRDLAEIYRFLLDSFRVCDDARRIEKERSAGGPAGG